MKKISMLLLVASTLLFFSARTTAQPCPCDPPAAEIEPNDVLPVAQTISLGEPFCGEISSPVDVDLVSLSLTENTTFRITIMHNDLPPECTPGLNPIVDVLAPDGQVVARCGDQSDASTVYESDFKIGPGDYVVRVASGLGSVGAYSLVVDGGSVVPPPAPELAIWKTGTNTITFFWDGSEYLPGETIEIEYADTPDGSYVGLTSEDATAGVATVFFLPFADIRFFRATAEGARQVCADPWTGSRLEISNEEELDGSPSEGVDTIVDFIQFAVNGDDEIVIGELQGHDPGDPGQQIVQDNSNAYGDELTAIDGWSGHTLDIYGRTITVGHMTFARDSDAGDVGIIDGRGEDQSSGETLLFGDLPQQLEGDAISYLKFGFDEEELCCRFKTIAFCGPFGIRPPPAGMPCPCPYAPNQTTCPPGPVCQPCNSCTLRVDMTGTLRRCICSFDPAPFGSPPTQIFCTFKPRFKCKHYECFGGGECNNGAACPGPNTFIPGNPTEAQRAACKRFCP